MIPFDRQEAIHIARKWVGTKHEWYARTPGEALDCIGFVACLGRALGYDIPEPILDGEKPYYEIGVTNPTLYIKYANLWGYPSKNDPRPGDILLLDPKHVIFTDATDPNSIIHNALYTGKTIIHCGPKGVEEEPFTDEWDLAIRGIFSFRGYSRE